MGKEVKVSSCKTMLINVEVAYASVLKPSDALKSSNRLSQVIIPLKVPTGSTILQAIISSQILQLFLELKSYQMDNQALEGRVGIYGHIKTLNTVLKDQDRIEIYADLLQDPKEARTKRVEKKMKEARRARELKRKDTKKKQKTNKQINKQK